MPTARSHRANAVSRIAIAGAVWLAASALGLEGCSDPSGPPPPPETPNATLVTVTVVAITNGQGAVVGTGLPFPLQVKIDSAGVPKAGVRIKWHTRAGHLTPIEGVSDKDGIASAAWTLDTVAGTLVADAMIPGAQASSVSFNARAVPGAAVAIRTDVGDGQTFPANRRPGDLIAVVTDRYRNAVEGQAVTWTIESGPVAFVTTGGATNPAGRSLSAIAAMGMPGNAVVRAALPGIGAAADFRLTIEQPRFEAVLHTGPFGYGGPPRAGFISSQNGSNPAVDTLPTGNAMTWTLEFDYAQHGVASVGTPAFQGRDFSYLGLDTISVVFALPGSYHYADPYDPGVIGIVVVK